MKVCVVLTALLAVAAAGNVRPYAMKKITVEKEFWTREMDILQLLLHVHQPMMADLKISEMAKLLKPRDFYKSATVAEEYIMSLFDILETQPLKRGEIFDPTNSLHLKHAKALTDLMRFAKDYDMFHKISLWAREHHNEGVFIFALSSAIREREDTRHIILPPLYEIMPNMFVHSETMQKAYETHMRLLQRPDKDIFVIPSNFSMFYHNKMRPDMRITYFTEDAALNAWNYEMNMGWVQLLSTLEKGKDNNFGEMMYFWQKQLLARYRLERLANNMEDLERFMLEDEKMMAFDPDLRYMNGKAMPMRPEMEPVETEDMLKERLRTLEERVTKLVDEGGIMVANKFEELSGRDGFRKLTQLINLDHAMHGPYYVMSSYFDNLMNKMTAWASRSADPSGRMNLAPSALMQYETQLRDPLYYSMLLRIHELYHRYKSLTTYGRKALEFEDFKIETLEFDRLMTYFENFDVELNNALNAIDMENHMKMSIVARQSRINHKPFSFQAVISSNKTAPAVVRLFIGPKRDAHGIEMTLEQRAPLMMELDRFVVDLTTGKNKIERSSKDFTHFKTDEESFRMIYKKVDDALKDKPRFQMDEDEYPMRFPEHLLLPKGKRTGMPYSMFMIVTPLEEPIKPEKNVMLDQLPLGYPFDLRMDYSEWIKHDHPDQPLVSNMMDKEVFIFHKKTDEMHEQY